VRVLVIDDDRELAEALGVGLRREQMAVDLAFDGDAGLERALVHDYDVIVLDRDLPLMAGDEVCAHLVKQRCRSRVLMLTAAATIEDRVDGLPHSAAQFPPQVGDEEHDLLLFRRVPAAPVPPRRGVARSMRPVVARGLHRATVPV
jgi:CheY-like chemotaxis protein